MNFEQWWERFNLECPNPINNREIALAAWMGALMHEVPQEFVSCSAQFCEMGDNKINQIKLCREHTAWGLKESKDWVESLPHTMTPKDGFSRQTLIAWIDQFNATGGRAVMIKGNMCDRCELRFKCYTER